MTMHPIKHEWRKHEKALYCPKARPELIQIPKLKFITIQGQGNPNSQHFVDHIQALYPIAYGIKMKAKQLPQKPAGYCDYTVYPLEGVWDITDEAKKEFSGTINKDDLVFKLMIRQPEFVDEHYFRQLQMSVQKRMEDSLCRHVCFEEIDEGSCIQMLHIGPFDTEPETFTKMENYASEIGQYRKSKRHREIYLSDFRKTAPEKLKTVLRFKVEAAS